VLPNTIVVFSSLKLPVELRSNDHLNIAGTTYRWMVDYGKTYLFRVVNAIMNADIFFAVAGHNLTVVGMDARYIKPISTDYIMISPGQTMDVLLTANQSLGHYYMAIRQYSSEDASVTGFDHVNTTAILQYKGNYTIPSSPSFPSTLPLYLDFMAALTFTSRIRSLASKDHPVNVPLNITERMYITVSMNLLYCPICTKAHGNETLVSTLNNISWVNPSTDVLHAYYRLFPILFPCQTLYLLSNMVVYFKIWSSWNLLRRNISGVYTTDFPDYPPSFYNFTGDEFAPENILLTRQGTKVKVLNYGEAVEIVFQGTSVLKGSVNHPMHLHGYSFYVVGKGLIFFDNETNPKGLNLVDPPEVNTFGVPKKGWLAIRFVANNPGISIVVVIVICLFHFFFKFFFS